MPPFNLSESVCENQPAASEAYASAMKVTKAVLDAQLVHLVEKNVAADGVSAEPASLHLAKGDLHLHRQRLLLELHAMGRRDLPW